MRKRFSQRLLDARALRAPEPPGLGHNEGPPLDPLLTWHGQHWLRAHKSAWKTPPLEVVRRRVERARELGMTYREYTLEILERGRYL